MRWLRRRCWRLAWWASWLDRKRDRRVAEGFLDWWRVNDEGAER